MEKEKKLLKKGKKIKFEMFFIININIHMKDKISQKIFLPNLKVINRTL